MSGEAMSARPLLVFDVNETLLDLDSLAPVFARIFGDAGAMRAWFAQMILYSNALTLSGGYVPFGELGGAVLRMQGAIAGVTVTDAELASVRKAIAAMPPHPEVPGALRRLRDAGFRLFGFTNNPRAVCEKQMAHAGIADLFERNFSVDDDVRRYKPAPESYAAVQSALGVAPDAVCLIACHAWDTMGAAACGWHAALITRPGNAPLGVGAQAEIVGKDLEAVASALIARFAAA